MIAYMATAMAFMYIMGALITHEHCRDTLYAYYAAEEGAKYIEDLDKETRSSIEISALITAAIWPIVPVLGAINMVIR